MQTSPPSFAPRLSPALLLGAVLLLLLGACASRETPPGKQSAGKPAVILVSLDGFRADYLSRGLTPHLSALAAQGARTAAMRPSFPSITFPNHYTLVTGLRPDEHGIVGNTMFDPDHPGEKFTMKSKEPFWWNEAEPVWVTAEKHGLNAGTLFWPGSEAVIHGTRPEEYLPFDAKMSDDARVDTLLSWFDAPPEKRPRFATLYFNVVDSQGHHFGPDSAEVNDALRDVDEGVGRLTDGLRARGIAADVIVVADHGMAAVPDGHVLFMDDLAPSSTWRWVTGGAYAGVDPAPGRERALEHDLLRRHDHLRCWKKQDIPADLHYGRNPRVPAFICLADVGWIVEDRAHVGPGRPAPKGEHGYDPAAPEMAALFLAAGPDIRPGTVLPPFDNVNVYPLVMDLLGIPPLPNDGALATFSPALSVPVTPDRAEPLPAVSRTP